MKKYLFVLFLFPTLSFSMSIEKKISLFESSCKAYLNSIIDKKLKNKNDPEERAKWEKVMFKDYNFAKNSNNSKKDRHKVIDSAIVTCDVQKKLGI